MTEQQTVRVHFIDGHTAIVPAKNIRYVGEEGAQSGAAIVDGREIPIYLRVEWGWTWEEQAQQRPAEPQEPTLVKCPYCGGHHQKYMVDACPLNPYKVS